MLTALDIDFDINTVVAFSTVRNTADSLSSRATRMVTLLLGEALRATSAREVTTYTIALAVGWLADTVGRVCTGRRSVAMLAGKVTRAADATERAGVVRVVTLLLALLISDLMEEQS